MSDGKDIALDALEEDDEFEEFETENWPDERDADREEKMWQDDWDDDAIEDDFSKQLRAELERAKSRVEAR